MKINDHFTWTYINMWFKLQIRRDLSTNFSILNQKISTLVHNIPKQLLYHIQALFKNLEKCDALLHTLATFLVSTNYTTFELITRHKTTTYDTKFTYYPIIISYIDWSLCVMVILYFLWCLIFDLFGYDLILVINNTYMYIGISLDIYIKTFIIIKMNILYLTCMHNKRSCNQWFWYVIFIVRRYTWKEFVVLHKLATPYKNQPLNLCPLYFCHQTFNFYHKSSNLFLPFKLIKQQLKNFLLCTLVTKLSTFVTYLFDVIAMNRTNTNWVPIAFPEDHNNVHV